MSDSNEQGTEWWVAHIGNNPKEFDRIVADFKKAYESHDRPEGMALFSHHANGRIVALSITPVSNPHCESIAQWQTHTKPPAILASVAWEAGDIGVRY